MTCSAKNRKLLLLSKYSKVSPNKELKGNKNLFVFNDKHEIQNALI